MFLDHFKTMAAYNRWANGRLYDACAGLGDAERKRDRAAFFGSIHNPLNHILVGDRAWLARIEGVSDGGTPLDTVLYDDFGGAAGRRSRLQQPRRHALPHAAAAGVHASLQP